MSGMLARVARRGAQSQVDLVSVVRHDAAQGQIAKIYAQLESDFGILAPPVILHSPAPANLAATWMMLRETLVATLQAERAVKEAVASGVSLGNRCPYCVDVHSMTLHGLTSGRDAAAIAAGQLDRVGDPHLRAVATWAKELGTRARPFPESHAPELIGVAVVFHYINRMVNVFLGESPFPPGLPLGARGGLQRVIGRFMRPTSLRHRTPGDSLDLLPPAPPLDDLGWADEAPTIADAFARAAAAIDGAAERSVPSPVREAVRDRLATWDGRPPGLGRSWTDRALENVPAPDRATGRLALLTAMASYQVDRSVIEAARRTRPAETADTELVELTSWSAFTAARTMAARA